MNAAKQNIVREDGVRYDSLRYDNIGYDDTVLTISLAELWQIFVRRLGIMLLAAALVVCGLFAYDQWIQPPRYASTATLYILRQNDSQEISSDADFSLALKVVNDCVYLVKSHAVVDQVIDTMGLDMTYRQLYDAISTSNPDNTRILEVTVEAETPQLAKEIVDNLCTVGQDKITQAMGFQQVNFYEKGTLEPTPCNGIGLRTYAAAALITAVLVYAAFLVAYLLDDRIRTEEDIQKYLGLSILGNIPDANSSVKEYKGYYGSYGYHPDPDGGKEAR